MSGEDDFAPGVESTLSFADAPSLELRERIFRAQGYTLSWLKAIAVNTSPLSLILAEATIPDLAGFYSRIVSLRIDLANLLDLIPPDGFFPGKDAAAAYEAASRTFAQLYRDMALSRATLPSPDLLERVTDLSSAVFQAPAAAITTLAEQAANAISRALGGTAAAIWRNLWPWLLVAGAGGVIYVFRAPIGRALGKVAQ